MQKRGMACAMHAVLIRAPVRHGVQHWLIIVAVPVFLSSRIVDFAANGSHMTTSQKMDVPRGKNRCSFHCMNDGKECDEVRRDRVFFRASWAEYEIVLPPKNGKRGANAPLFPSIKTTAFFLEVYGQAASDHTLPK